MQIAEIEDIYRLSPLQQEMQSEDRAHADGLSLIQLCAILSGPLSPPLLEEAWNRVAARHAALRTFFRADKPFQVVQRQVRLPFEIRADAGGDPADIARFLAEDRARGIDPTRAPMLRLALLRTGTEEHLLACTHHRLILDGGSGALVLGEVLALYAALLQGENPEPERSPPLRESVDWLRRQEPAEAGRFWRQELLGFTALPHPGSPAPLPGRSGSGSLTLRLTACVTAALRSLADAEGLALATLVQGAWALLLARHSGREDVLFGTEVPGRPPALPGADSLVGRFAHTLPLRVTVEPDAPLRSLLHRIEERRAEVRPYEHFPLSQVLEGNGLPSPPPLFHSRLVVDSLPPAAAEGAPEIRELQRIEASAAPLTLSVQPGDELALQAVYQKARFEEAEAAALLKSLHGLLESFAADPGRRLSEIAVATTTPGTTPGTAGAGHRLDEIARMVHGHTHSLQEGPAHTTGRKVAGDSGLVPVPRDRPLPATFYQEWALQLEGVERNSIPSALHIQGRVHLGALQRSLTEIVRRHESLRTSFRREGGEASLVIAPPAEVPLPVLDLAELPEKERAELLRRLIAQHGSHAFDMERGPLFVAKAVRLGGQEHVLLMSVHHLVSDGWSIQVLQRELITLYTAFSQGRPSPLPPLPIQLADFAHWQRRVFAGEALTAQLAWWGRTLSSLPPPPGLPNDLPRPDVLGPHAVEAGGSLAPEPAQALRALAQASQGSLPMLLLAAVDTLLHLYSGQDDLIVSLIYAARNRPELSGQIGLFMNTVPVRADLSGNPSFRQVMQRVRDAVIEAYDHQDVPFPRLLGELFPGRKLTRTLLSGVCFNMLSFAETAVARPQGGAALPGGLTLRPLGVEEAVAKHDLAITCQEREGAVLFSLLGAADLFTPGRIEQMAHDFEVLLGRVAADPDLPLDRLRSIVSPA